MTATAFLHCQDPDCDGYNIEPVETMESTCLQCGKAIHLTPDQWRTYLESEEGQML